MIKIKIGRLIRIVGGTALASSLLAGLLTIGTTPASAASDACKREAAAMPAPWHSATARSTASPGNAYDRAPMYVPPYPKAQQAADQAAAAGDAAKAKRLRRIAAQPRGIWFTDGRVGGADLTARVADVVTAARKAGRVATLVMYAIPLRDCGGYSSGGAASGQAYVSWVKAFRAGLLQGGVGKGPGVSVIIEPDALALLGNLPSDRQAERLELIKAAANLMAWTPKTSGYLDAATRGWIPADVMADRLSRAGVGMARGFSLNVANFNALPGEVRYGNQIVGRIGWKHFVIDTGRNGNGANGQFCNPDGRALGTVPQARPGGRVDAYLWVKPPGESDGDCSEGDPPAGEFFSSYANELAVNAGWYTG
ncbi:MAG TPA: glycoside hydrolase family 6 protein [Microlunatus sp.]